MNSLKKISIIIISYNELEYLEDAIKSCLNQDIIDDIEIVIGDDGSDDGSIGLINRYSRKYSNIIKYFIMDRSDINTKMIIPSIRVSNIIKRAMDYVTGEYIMIMSGDDYNIESDRLSVQLTLLEKEKKYKSCYCDYQKIWDNGQKKDVITQSFLGNRAFWSGIYVHISCFLFEKECFDSLLERFCDDTGMIYSILATGKSKHIEKMGFAYRQREKSIMHKADVLELNLLELLLFQDCINGGQMKTSSYSRFSRPFTYVFLHRKVLNNEKYQKYIEESRKYNNDFIGGIIGFDDSKLYIKIKLLMLLLKTIFFMLTWNGIRIICRIIPYRRGDVHFWGN